LLQRCPFKIVTEVLAAATAKTTVTAETDSATIPDEWHSRLLK